MTTLDSLPADQRAVLSLLLVQGRSYEGLAQTLRIAETAVRERAHGALAVLGPGESGLSARRRGEIGDWLLAQGPDDERAETESFLGHSEAGRAWAAAIADALRPLGSDRLPKVPSGPPASETEDDAEPAATAQPATAEATTAGAATEPRVSRRGGAVLLALAALLIAVIAVVRLGGDEDKPASDRPASTNTARQSDPRVVTQVNLKPPSGAPAGGALGVLQVIKQGPQQAILVRAQGLPTLPNENTGYGVWLSSSPSMRTWLGYGNYDAAKHQFVATGVVAADVTAYGEVFITRETGEGPKEPGTIYLRGAIQS